MLDPPLNFVYKVYEQKKKKTREKERQKKKRT